MSEAGDAPLAVYGTLRRGERNHPLLAGTTYLGDAFVRGILRHVPAAPTRDYGFPVLLPDGEGRVRVELYRVIDADTWVRLDALERYDPADEAGSEFLRRTVLVLDGPTDEAQVYVYNGPLEVLGEVIERGDWLSIARRER
jgi:gamma-glutamylcyclotransferase (GGCT)/AIG2-like uncharacterized protein YtfP